MTGLPRAMPLRLEQLRYFVAVADEGQITRSAAKLHIAQPALSQSIAQLEAELRLKLFERHPRGVTLTAAGRAFYGKATIALAASEDAAMTARTLQRAAAGTVAFGFVGSPLPLHTPQLVATLAKTHPNVVLDYRELRFPTEPTESWLDDVDVAFCRLPPPSPGIWTRELRREWRVLLAPDVHPTAVNDGLCVKDALQDTFIGLHPSVAPWYRGFWSLDDHRGGPPIQETRHAAAWSQDLFAAIASRQAVTTVPAFQAAIVTKVVERVVAIPLTDAEPVAVGIIGRKDHLNESVEAVIAAAEHIASERPSDPLEA